VSRSTKDTAEAGVGSGAESSADPDGHDKFLADLGAFADGEQAARAADTATGSQTDEGAGGDGEPRR
jgi:hypothetical protein